jgi:AraC-like DNA-binding protein
MATEVPAVFPSYAEMMRETDYARFEQEHRSGGSLGINMFIAHQDAMEMTDPPNAELAFTSVLSAEGDMEFDFNDGWTRSPMPPNSLTMQPAHQSCRFRTAHPHTILVAGVDHGRLRALLDEAGVRDDPFEAFYATVTPMPEVTTLMTRAWREAEAAGPAANLFVDGAFLTALGHILRACGRPCFGAPASALDDDRLRRAVEFVEAHIDEALTVAEIAAIACLSPSHFAHAFKAATGNSVWAYVHRRRCERARELLLTTQMPVTEIALSCGFANSGHLSTSFRAAYGLSPRAARRASCL